MTGKGVGQTQGEGQGEEEEGGVVSDKGSIGPLGLYQESGRSLRRFLHNSV